MTRSVTFFRPQAQFDGLQSQGGNSKSSMPEPQDEHTSVSQPSLEYVEILARLKDFSSRV